MEIKKNIQGILKERGKTQVDLCREMGIHIQSLQYYFRGNLTMAKLTELANALQVEPWELIKPYEPKKAKAATKPDPQEHIQQPTQAPGIFCPYCGNFVQLQAHKHEKKPQETQSQDTTIQDYKNTLF